ncbi:MAG: DUF1801 domain-containing protein [Pseudomonadota bacterium]
MAKANNKTVATDASVDAYINGIADPDRKRQAKALDAMLQSVTRRPPVMWGKTIVGYGRYEYRYDSGREGEFSLVGFSSRARNLTIYVMPGFSEFESELADLGPHTLGKSCLYIKDLDAVDHTILKRILRRSVAIMRKRYKCH